MESLPESRLEASVKLDAAFLLDTKHETDNAKRSMEEFSICPYLGPTVEIYSVILRF